MGSKAYFFFNRYSPLALEFFIALTVFFLPISKALIEIGTTGAIVLWLIRKVILKEGFQIPRAMLVSYIIFLLLCLVSLIPASLEEWRPGIRGLLKWLQSLAFFCLCAEWFKTKERAQRILVVFLGSMALVTVNGFYQLAAGVDFLRQNLLHPGRIIRMTSSLGAPNSLAAFYLFSIPLTLICLKEFKRYRAILALMGILSTCAFILTFSRAAFLGLIAAGTLTLLIDRRWKWLFGSAAGILLAICTIEPLRHNFVTSLNFDDITIGERLLYWRYTWDMIRTDPLTGIGLNLYYQKLPLFIPSEELYRGYAHNSYLQMWAEIGIFGFLAFLLPLLSLLNFSRRTRIFLEPALTAACLAFLFQAFFDNNFYAIQTAYLFWLFWGMRTGLVMTAEGKKQKPLKAVISGRGN